MSVSVDLFWWKYTGCYWLQPRQNTAKGAHFFLVSVSNSPYTSAQRAHTCPQSITLSCLHQVTFNSTTDTLKHLTEQQNKKHLHVTPCPSFKVPYHRGDKQSHIGGHWVCGFSKAVQPRRRVQNQEEGWRACSTLICRRPVGLRLAQEGSGHPSPTDVWLSVRPAVEPGFDQTF